MKIVISEKAYDCLYDISKEYEIKLIKLINRYDSGKRGKELVKNEKDSKYARPKNLIDFHGRKYSLTYLSEKYNIRQNILTERNQRGWKDDQLIKPTPSSLKNKFLIIGNEYYRVGYLSRKHGITMTKLARKYKIFD